MTKFTYFTATYSSGLNTPIKVGENEKFASRKGAKAAARLFMQKAVADEVPCQARIADFHAVCPEGARKHTTHLVELVRETETENGNLIFTVVLEGHWLGQEVFFSKSARVTEMGNAPILADIRMEQDLTVYIKEITVEMVDDDEVVDPTMSRGM